MLVAVLPGLTIFAWVIVVVVMVVVGAIVCFVDDCGGVSVTAMNQRQFHNRIEVVLLMQSTDITYSEIFLSTRYHK